MHTHTLASNAGFGRRVWWTILPLFALLISLLSPSEAKAQAASTAGPRSVVVTAGTNTSTYDAVPTSGGTTVGGGIYAGTDFGTYDINNGTLQLSGATIDINEMGGEVYNTAVLQYRVYQTNTTAPAYSDARSIALTQTGYNASTGVRTFSATSATVNLLSLVTVAGNGTGYTVGVRVHAVDNADGIDLYSAQRAATFTATGTPVFTPVLSMTTALISASSAADVSYDINNPPNTRPFNTANLGDFDINNGRLLLNGGTATTTENGGNNVSSVTIYYRTRLAGAGGGAFNPIMLGQTGIVTNADGSRTRTFSVNAAGKNLLTNISTSNNYNVDLYLQASYTNGSNNFDVTDNNGGSNYVATFSVSGTAIVTSTWTGGFNDNWFDTRNWDAGVPNANVNARIPDFPSGTTVNYPNIYSGVVKPATPATTVTNPDGTVDNIPASPGYDNTNSGNAQVRDLTMNGSNQLQRSILRLIQGRLDVFGDFNNPQGSFIQRATAIISFKSSGNQTISGSINGFTNVEIDGGANSVKTLTNSFAIKSGGYLKFINGILTTDISLVSSNFVSFDAATTEAGTGTVTPAAQLLGESETSYLRGFLTTTQTAPPGATQTFGNTGLTLRFTGNDPGNVTVTRNTGGNYAPSAFGGGTPKPGIRRVFGVQPTNPATNNGGLNAVLTFRYLNNELVNLRVNSTNPPDYSGSVDASKLSLYVSTTGGNAFSQLGRDGIANNILTKSGVTTFATFTLSEQQTPLPVKLIAFDAKRTGNNALITWATASEISNSGFEVQVSTDGATFRKVAFVASQAINSANTLKYSFLDEESGKTGTRYYRLRQIDEDGTNDYSPVRVVSFDAGSLASQATTLTAYPNPFTQGELPSIIMQSAVAGSAHLQLVDMLGREVSRQDFTATVGIQQVNIAQAASLNSGIYMAKVTLATGEVKTVRIQKR